MSIEKSDIEKIASLARIRVDQSAVPEIANRINDILKMVDSMQAVDTADIEPMANPLDAVQRLRVDLVTERNQREAFQAIAPQVEQGLYLVPKVIE
ncbi:aspartyl/glutamyl-tRNA amidotransferase subunit C [marine gamma proteobacterium HTCC2143]|jgi:aspartyl-tRNA(Asn)/glutamyl-tRNA(Gln) amidotransferase subunit C|uniref:Aspartyl/glutamyl-tRNA(Asn/Gln) amidotransferase subunit C n=1 Tax=marine gamma proteobacterium HTCC2143 TaxID=247633 RepID=A0YEV1_9GAMM|nr:aspartyl/glutamyl-tRNA amidotransferase subunit C [marine gamma proteobacterium HTCC2143]